MHSTRMPACPPEMMGQGIAAGSCMAIRGAGPTGTSARNSRYCKLTRRGGGRDVGIHHQGIPKHRPAQGYSRLLPSQIKDSFSPGDALAGADALAEPCFCCHSFWSEARRSLRFMLLAAQIHWQPACKNRGCNAAGRRSCQDAAEDSEERRTRKTDEKAKSQAS